MVDIIALGCGLVGKFVITKLSEQGKHVFVVDIDVPDTIKHNSNISYTEGDVFEVLPELPDTNVVLNLLPGAIGEKVRAELVASGKHVIDLAFTEVEPSTHHELAITTGSKLVWDVGIAPGLSNMILRQEFARDNNILDVTIKVGGNPSQPDAQWSYMAPFSPSDVIEEYTRPARIIVDGEVKIVEAISDRHIINVANYGQMEAFLTDGLRSLIKSGFSPNMREYTVRWPGHIGKWLEEKDTLTESELLDAWGFDENREEFTWMEIKLLYNDYEVVWEVLDTGKDGDSSMARTTGLVTIACVIELLEDLSNDTDLFNSGVYAPENLPLESIDRVIEYLKSQDVTIIREIIK